MRSILDDVWRREAPHVLGAGHPAADVCRSFIIMMRAVAELAENYLDRYAALGGIARHDILAWLPVVAAARRVLE